MGFYDIRERKDAIKRILSAEGLTFKEVEIRGRLTRGRLTYYLSQPAIRPHIRLAINSAAGFEVIGEHGEVFSR